MEALQYKKYQEEWVQAKANVTILYLGMWDIIKDRLGVESSSHFYDAFDHHVRQFVTSARNLILEDSEKESFDLRMKHRHTFVLIAPRPRPGFSVFRNELMSPEIYEIFRNSVVEHLKSKKWELFTHYPRVALCTPTENFISQIHQYIIRLICWKCSPRYDNWTLQMKNLHIGC